MMFLFWKNFRKRIEDLCTFSFQKYVSGKKNDKKVKKNEKVGHLPDLCL
jgi:hypothetical protein